MIDSDIVKILTRGMYPPNADIHTVGFSTHRLRPLVTSSVFSPPGELIQMDAGGSIGTQISDITSWSKDVGEVKRTISTRTFYRKRYCTCSECRDPLMKVVQLRADFSSNGVKNPVIHDAYVKRSFFKYGRPQAVYMLWGYQFKPTRDIAGTKELREWSIDGDFERCFTFDIIAASTSPIEYGSLEDWIRLAHDVDFLKDYVRPALLTASCEPSPIIRREWIEVPRVIVQAVPITTWMGSALPSA